MVRLDPVGQICMRGQGLYSWSDVYQSTPPSKVFLDLKEGTFNPFQGYTSVIRRDKQWSVFSLAGRKIPKNIRNVWLIDKVAPYLHDVFMALQAKLSTVLSLTKREKDVLQWVMVGKTNWDVSVILNISERTVKFHLQNIMNKFGVHSRSHAVALAVKYNLISLR